MLSPLARVSIALLCLSPSALFAQYGRYSPSASLDPRQRRAARERAVAAVGATGRDFVETYGEDAVAAIFACPRPVALQLAEFHASGNLGRLSRPRDLLRVISKPGHGGDVASWAMIHVGELTDADHFDAYLRDPLSYALSLKKLEQGAAEIRDRRLGRNAAMTRAPAMTPLSANGLRMIGLGSGVTAIIALLVWRVRQRRA